MSESLPIGPNGCVSKFMSSIGAAMFGIVLFLASFWVIWSNEGRPNLAKLSADSIAISAQSVDAANEGKLVAAAGRLSGSPVGDGLYIADGDYLQVSRSVEMFAWAEESESKDNGTKTYSYSQKWTSMPSDSSRFAQPAGHENPKMTIESRVYKSANATLDAFSVNMSKLDLPSTQDLVINENVLKPGSNVVHDSEYVFVGEGSLAAPKIGDMRISYNVVRNNINVTVFGKQSGNSLDTYVFTKQDTSIYRAFDGNREEALQELNLEHKIMGWILRIVSLLMLWMAICMILGPISAMFGAIPMLENFSSTIINFLAFIPALGLWIIAEIVAIIAHNPWLLALTALVFAGAGYGIFRYMQSRKKGAAPTPSLT